jgi:hypothetical protein
MRLVSYVAIDDTNTLISQPLHSCSEAAVQRVIDVSPWPTQNERCRIYRRGLDAVRLTQGPSALSHNHDELWICRGIYAIVALFDTSNQLALPLFSIDFIRLLSGVAILTQATD